jgi:dephospho-CoA kinase
MVDADVIARQVVEPGTMGLSMIVAAFGSEILLADESLDRVKLGNIVFSDKKKRLVLNLIMGPLIHMKSKSQLSLHARDHLIVGFDAALICENGNAEKYRPLIVVHCPEVMQIDRLMRRNGLTREQAVARITAQMPVAEKIAMADYTIDTSGSIESSIEQTEVIIDKLIHKQ